MLCWVLNTTVKKTKGFSASGSGAPTDDFADLNLTDNGEGKRTIDYGIASTLYSFLFWSFEL